MKLKSGPNNQSSKKPNSPLNYTLWLLGRRSRTKFELEKKLREKEVDDAEVISVIRRLEELEFVDDLKFAKDYISNSERFKPKGRQRLFWELIKRGVPKDLIEKALDDVKSDQTALADEALKTYSRRLKNLPREKQYQRAVSFLLRRGFSYDEAKKAVNNIQNEII